jgi:hypothetical protein
MKLSRGAEFAKQNVKKGLALAAIGGTAIVAGGCGAETHNFHEAHQAANKKYERAWDHASPAGKFLMQYLRVVRADVVKHKDDSHAVDEVYEFKFNDGCLGGTSYDIAGGHFNVSASASGFLSSASAHAEGTIPTAAASAYVSDKNPDVLRVQSGHDHPQVLTFRGVQGDGPLIPIGQTTLDVLKTWGCHEGPKGSELITDKDLGLPPADPNAFIDQ